jgi:chemotaxis protein MotB
MARKKKTPEPKGFPLWQSTFSDLMNLLVCFFVLLFSMSSVDANKYEEMVQALNTSFSIMSGSSGSSESGILINSGISQLNQLNQYYTNLGAENSSNEEGNKGGSGKSNKGNSDDPESTVSGSAVDVVDEQGNKISGSTGGETGSEKESGDSSASGSAVSEDVTTEEALEKYEEKLKSNSESAYDKASELVRQYKLDDTVNLQMDTSYNYISMNISGSFLFDSGSANLKKGAKEVLNRAAKVLEAFPDSQIVIVGHTDNVPQTDTYKYKNNLWLSSARACTVLEYLSGECDISPKRLQATGKGEYDPIASNKTAEGRQKNRRVEIQIMTKVAR